MRPPDLRVREAPIVDALQRIGRRLFVRETVRAYALGTAAAALVASPILPRAFRPAVVAAIVVGAAVTAWRLRARRFSWQPLAAAGLVEGLKPHAANVVITARELIEHPERARPWVRARVLDDAAEIVDQVDVGAAVPLRRDALLLGGALVLLAGVLGGVPQKAGDVAHGAAVRAVDVVRRAASGEPTITATITPPAYTGLAPATVRDPDRVSAVQDSRVRFTLHGDGAWRIRFGAAALAGERSGQDTILEAVLSESGYFVFERDEERSGRGRLVPVVVTPDRAPSVRIDAPARDLLVPRPDGTVHLSASASDDFGLQTLELRYTKVSGSGEQFEFTEGTLPLQVVRSDPRAWRGTGAFALAQLGLQPGDSVVYRALARDHRPGDAGLASSDTYFIEVAGPGQVALEGFELPPDRERYALSQQMILLKLQRLRARERSITRQALEEAVGALAAEQRAVRANFVFLMGGEVEDEEQEAEHSHEIQEGRLENNARREIMAAIQHMGRVEQALAAIDTGGALPAARAAVDALQRAFGRNRYFLRTLPVRSRIDPSRRLSGKLDETADWARSRSTAPEEPAHVTARRILAALLSPPAGASVPEAAVLARLAEEALAAAPGAPEWQEASARLIRLRDAILRADSSVAVENARGEAIAPLVALVQKQAVPLPAAPAAGQLRRSWADEMRRR